MRRLVALAALVAFVSLAAPVARGAEYPGGAEGCTHTGGDAKPCVYKAKRSGGYVGDGEWTVTVTRGTGPAATKYTFSSKTHESRCLNAILKGDQVVISAKSGRIAAGNPFPAAADSGPSLSSGKPGQGHKDCKKK